MSSFLVPMMGVLLLFISSETFAKSSAAPIQMHEKPSLRWLLQDFSKAKKPENIFEQFRKYVKDSESFVRIEIDDEKVHSELVEFLKWTLKRDGEFLSQKKHFQVKEDLSVWLNFAADLSYEEASLTGLKLCHELRLMVFDFIDQIPSQKISEILKQDELWLPWSQSVRIPWPADRVIMSELTRLKSPKSQFTARQVVASLQKNPYQSYSEALSKAQGPKTLELKNLEKFWTDQEILLMKTEVNRLSRIQLRLALTVFQNRFGVPAPSLDVLVEKKLIDRIPVDYISGKVMSLDQVK